MIVIVGIIVNNIYNNNNNFLAPGPGTYKVFSEFSIFDSKEPSMNVSRMDPNKSISRIDPNKSKSSINTSILK